MKHGLTIHPDGVQLRTHNRRITIYDAEENSVYVYMESILPEKSEFKDEHLYCRGHYRAMRVKMSIEGAAHLGYALSEYLKNKLTTP